MTRYRITSAPSAENDLAGILDFITEHTSAAAALHWYGELVEKIKTLQEFPERRSVADESTYFNEEIRVLLVGYYRVLYRIMGDEVQVLHVRHGARERIL